VLVYDVGREKRSTKVQVVCVTRELLTAAFTPFDRLTTQRAPFLILAAYYRIVLPLRCSNGSLTTMRHDNARGDSRQAIR